MKVSSTNVEGINCRSVDITALGDMSKKTVRTWSAEFTAYGTGDTWLRGETALISSETARLESLCRDIEMRVMEELAD